MKLVEDKIPKLLLEKQASLTAAELKKMSAVGITSLMDARVKPSAGDDRAEPGEEDVWRRNLLVARSRGEKTA